MRLIHDHLSKPTPRPDRPRNASSKPRSSLSLMLPFARSSFTYPAVNCWPLACLVAVVCSEHYGLDCRLNRCVYTLTLPLTSFLSLTGASPSRLSYNINTQKPFALHRPLATIIPCCFLAISHRLKPVSDLPPPLFPKLSDHRKHEQYVRISVQRVRKFRRSEVCVPSASAVFQSAELNDFEIMLLFVFEG